MRELTALQVEPLDQRRQAALEKLKLKFPEQPKQELPADIGEALGKILEIQSEILDLLKTPPAANVRFDITSRDATGDIKTFEIKSHD